VTRGPGAPTIPRRPASLLRARLRRSALRRGRVALSALVLTLPAAAGPTAQAPQQPPPSEPTIEVVALDRDGRVADKLGASDFVVTVDGVRRTVASARLVIRGPGAAAEATARLARGEEPRTFASETARSVLVVIDEASIPRGAERDLVAAANAFLDRLGLDDRVGLVRLPFSSNAVVSLTTERPEARQALAAVTGRLVPVAAAEPAAPAPVVSAEQERMTGLESGQTVRSEAAPAARADAEARAGVQGLTALRGLFAAMRGMPGRKVVAVFSAGVPAASSAAVDEVAMTALLSHAAVHVFGVRAALGPDAADLLGTSPLDRLASATGGSFVGLGRNPEKAVDRMAGELTACYVLALEPALAPARPGRRALKVETTRKGVVTRAAAWQVAQPDAGDVAASAPDPAAPMAPGALSVPVRTQAPDRRAELQVALARLFAYADGYERQYSMLVAEEDYRQSAPKGASRMRSDLLLVRPGAAEEWVSFRDVFEVDGRPVRDRDERLRRLFLDGTPESMARLAAIREESARYNIGAVERTINVPLLPLTFLRSANRERFEYELAGTAEAAGNPAWRIRYVERSHPTIVGDLQGEDIPVSGHFLVDTITGAIVESRLEARRGESRAEIVVKYRSDPALGLWVPAEMKETYSTPDTVNYGRSGYVSRSTVEGRATYSNFRRFQVKTEEKVK
jgi:VWFA-related protein